MRDRYKGLIAVWVSFVVLFLLYYVAQYFWSPELVAILDNNARYFWYVIGTGVLAYPLLHNSGKREKFVLWPIVISHIVIIFVFFSTNYLGVKLPLAIATILSLVILILAINIHHWFRIFVILPLSILFVGTAIISFIPQYDTIPTEQDFYDMVGTNLYVVIEDVPMILRDITADIKVQSLFTGQEISISIDDTSPNFRIYPIRRPATIYFESSDLLYNTFAFIQFYDGNTLPIPTQTSLTIQYTQTWYVTYATGRNIEKTLSDAAWFINNQKDTLNTIYHQQRNDFFIDRVWWSWTQNMYIDKGVWYILYVLSIIAPSYYTDNYDNYKEFKLSIWSLEQEDDRSDLFQNESTSIRENILPWLQRSRMFRWFISE